MMQAPDSSPEVDPDELLVVSNREPYVHETPETIKQPAGGLASALDATMCTTGGTWIAWGSGAADFAVADDDHIAVPPGAPQYTLRRIPLSDADVSGYYYGYSNQLLWPLAHQFISRITTPTGAAAAYRRVNEQFADAVLDTLDSDSTTRPVVWFQDYHLGLAPRLVRDQATIDVQLNHFWHIPWPTPETFARAPDAEALLDGLLANDRIGFHIEAYRQRFLETVRQLCPDATVHGSAVEYDGHHCEIYVQPIGVDSTRIEQTTTTNEARQFWQSLRTKHGLGPEETIFVSVDRLDYTKGILNRLDAIETLLQRRDDLHGSVRFIQKGSYTRSAIPAYERYQQRIKTRIATLNHRFSQPDWQPIVYLDGDIERAAVLGLLAGGDVGIVTPVVDGFNLTAVEYVLAAAAWDGTGELVLSRFCGAAEYLDGAVMVNPHDTEQFATALAQVVDEQPTDWERLVERAQALSIADWIEAGLSQRHR